MFKSVSSILAIATITACLLGQSDTNPGQPKTPCEKYLENENAPFIYLIDSEFIGDYQGPSPQDWVYSAMTQPGTCIPPKIVEFYLRTGSYGQYELGAGVENCCGDLASRSFERAGRGQIRQKIHWCFDCPCPAATTTWTANVAGSAGIEADLNVDNCWILSDGSGSVISEALVEYTGAGTGSAHVKVNATKIEGQGGTYTIGGTIGTGGVGVTGAVTNPINNDVWSYSDDLDVSATVGNTLESGCARGKNLTMRGVAKVSGSITNGAVRSAGGATTSFGNGGLTATFAGNPCDPNYPNDGNDSQRVELVEILAAMDVDGCELSSIVATVEPPLSYYELNLLSEFLPTQDAHDAFWNCVDRAALGLPSLEWIQEHGVPAAHIATPGE